MIPSGIVPSLATAQRIVIKIGSALVVDEQSATPRQAWLDSVAADIQALRDRGVEVIVVSSGAIALARRTLGLTQKKLKLEEKQAAAAVGQIRLAQAWAAALSARNLTAAQLLLTLDDTEDRRRYLNARETLSTLLGLRCIPVINENDTVATAEIRFGDNDRLAARVAEMVQADQLILLSDIDGLYTADPRRNPDAQHIPVVETLTPEIEAMGGEPPPGYSSGGMRTKLVAARIATQAGCHRQGRTPAAVPGTRCPLHLVPARARGPQQPQTLDRRVPVPARHPDRRRRRRPRPGERPLFAASRRPFGGRHLQPRRRRNDPGPGRHHPRPGPLRLRQHRRRTDRRPAVGRDRNDPGLARPGRDRAPG